MYINFQPCILALRPVNDSFYFLESRAKLKNESQPDEMQGWSPKWNQINVTCIKIKSH